MEKVLEVNKLSKLYKNGRGIRNISFNINYGDVFGFLGPNGAGKTTVMKIITGLCRADQGEVKIFGNNISTNFPEAMSSVGCLIETATAYENMTAYDNLKLAGRFYSDIKKTRIAEVLNLVGLNSVQHERVKGFSLGMKQRLGIASAILARPKFVILDEPTNGLDIEGMIDVRNLILNLSRGEKVTFFISSHLVHELELVCNRIGILTNGELVKIGEIKELLAGKDITLESFLLDQIKQERGSVLGE